jgi:hypothetical protein
MNLHDDIVYRCRRLGSLGQLHPGRSRSSVRHKDRLHDNFLPSLVEMSALQIRLSKRASALP